MGATEPQLASAAAARVPPPPDARAQQVGAQRAQILLRAVLAAQVVQLRGGAKEAG